MPIPKIIYQTYSFSQLPIHARVQIWAFRRRNKEYQYEFYNREMREEFIKKYFPEKVYNLYIRLQIGAAQADFFRYAILYIHGGIYIDLDASIIGSLKQKIDHNSSALIAREKTNKHLYAQWALVYEKKHPILKQTLEIILNNIHHQKYPNSVHQVTGPTPYSMAVRHYLSKNNNDPNLLFVQDNYKGIFRFKTILSRIHALFNKKSHWRQIQKSKTVYTLN